MRRFDLLAVCLVGVSVCALAGEKSRLQLMTYAMGIDYRDTVVKDRAYQVGLQTILTEGKHDFEFRVDWLEINFQPVSDIELLDLMTTWSFDPTDHLRTKLGIHYIESQDIYADEGVIGLFGLHVHDFPKYDIGVDAIVSKYQNYPNGLSVTQIAPKALMGLAGGEGWGVGALARGYYIALDDDIGYGKREFWSLEGGIQAFVGEWQVTISGWEGEQVAAVRNEGSLVFTQLELHSRGYGVEIRYGVTLDWYIAIRADCEEYTSLAVPNEDSYLNAGALILGWKF